MNQKIAVTAVIACAALLLTACGSEKQAEVQMHSLSIGNVIKAEKELSTLTYDYTDFGVYKVEAKSIDLPLLGKTDIPLTDDEVFFTYGGSVKVGFQLEDITPVVDEEAKTITVEVPEPAILSHTPDHDAEKIYIPKEHVLGTSSEERFNGIDDSRAELRKEKEKLVIGDEAVREKAIEEYQQMCKSWLLSADPAVSEYTIRFEMPEKETETTDEATAAEDTTAADAE